MKKAQTYKKPCMASLTPKTFLLDNPLSVDHEILLDILNYNNPEDLEARIYGNKRAKEEQNIKKFLKRIGVPIQIVESKERRALVIKLKNHMKFVVLGIEKTQYIEK
ncbi:hypothetical protein NEFER03_0676 [Nematocida sp. LUAm3]|nr:hypothetical protein NEFER03_0676 [Nematocida sp. LUAm3]KAI5175135.1 hypothetical protein NEFER02_1096 [Nematocida sp. LUAm2]KAI5178193.1 hypothetical protein NEFER01_1371 [Nematocida sp. LUAm1]